MNREDNRLETLSSEDLDATTGGAGGWATAKKVGKFVAKKAGPIGLAIGAYDGISAGYDSYQKGNGWGTIVKDAALNAVW